MSRLWVLGALIAPVLGGAAASAAPNITIDHAVARVTVVLEPRNDVVAQMVRTNPHFPIQIQRAGDGVSIWGDLGHTSANCHGPADRPHVSVWMRGDVRYDDMPQIVIHAPLNASVRAAGAVYGVVGRGDSLTLSNAGCGDWVVGDQTGALTFDYIREVFRNPIYREGFTNALRLAVGSTFLAFSIAAPLASEIDPTQWRQSCARRRRRPAGRGGKTTGWRRWRRRRYR